MRMRGLLAALAVTALAGCDDLGIGIGTRVEAVAILNAQGQVLASVTPGNVVTGELAVPAGGSRTLFVELRDGAGRPLPLPGGATIEVSTTTPLIADWTPEGADSGRLVGVSRGTTSLRVDYRVGTRLEYGSPFIPVVVQ